MMFITLIINLIFFILVCLLNFTLPGLFLLKSLKDKLSNWENWVLSTIFGYLLFTLIGYILLSIHLIFLLIPAILFLDFWSFRYLKNYKKTFSLPSRNKLIILVLVFLLGILGQLLIIAPSGILLNGELVFWSSHGHDASWHIALMNEIKQGFPLQNPIFATEKLVNYHFFSDIAPALFNLFFHLSTLDLYFRFFPLLFSFLLGACAYFLGKRLGGSFSAGIWATIFTYFAGSFGYVVTYLRDRTISGESLFWASQPQSSSGNPPQIIAFIIVLALLNLFFYLQRYKSKSIFLLCILLTGTLVEFKSYAAIVLLISLGIVGVWQAIKIRNFTTISLFFLSSILSIVLYFPNSSNQTSFLIFEPWWFIRTLIVAPDRLNWLDLELRRQTYLADGNWKRVLELEMIAFLIFLFGNLGMRFLGVLVIFRGFRLIFQNSFNLLLTSIAVSSLILPLLFLQKGVVANSIQFFSYFLLLFGILAGISVSNILNKIRFTPLKIFLSASIIILAIPTQLGLIYGFYSRSAFAKVTPEELSALNYLATIKNSEVILTPPINKDYKSLDLTPPIWAWSDTSYVSAFSRKTTYIADLEQLDNLGYNFKDRLAFQKLIFEATDSSIIKEKLIERNINYLYFPKTLAPKANLSKSNLYKIFSNSSFEIWSAK